MSKCDTIIPIESFTPEAIEAFKQFNENITKTNKYDYTAITIGDAGNKDRLRNAFGDLFSGVVSNVRAGLDVLLKSISDSGRTDISDKFRVAGNPKSTTKLLAMLGGSKDVSELIENALTMRQVLDALKTEEQLQENAGMNVEDSDAAAKLGSVEGRTSLVRLAGAVGKALDVSMPAVQANQARISKESDMTERGMKAITRLVDAGLIVIEDGAWIAKGVRDGTGDRASTDKTGLMEGKVVSLVNKAFNAEDVENNDELTAGGQQLVDALGEILEDLARITTPQTEGRVLTEAERRIMYKDQDRMHTEMSSRAYKFTQGSGFSINKDMQGIVSELHGLYVDSDDATFKQKLRKKFGDDYAGFIESVLGLQEGSIDDSIESGRKSGQAITSYSALSSLMSDYESMNKDEFYFTYFMAQNTRTFLSQTSMQYQANNKMIRPMLQASTAVDYEVGSDAATEFIARGAEQFGVARAVITGEDTGNALIERLVRKLNAGRLSNDPSASMDIMKVLVNEGDKLGLKTSKLWEQFAAISLIADVRAGVKSGTISSKHLSESDATASGLIIKLMMSAHIEGVQDMLRSMGLGMEYGAELDSFMEGKSAEELSGIEGRLDAYIQDAYAPVLNKITENVDIAITKKEKKIQAIMDANEGVSREQAESDESGTKIVASEHLENIKVLAESASKSVRDVIKYVVIKFAYHQSANNNVISFADTLSRDIINGGAKSAAKINLVMKQYGIEREGDVKEFDGGRKDLLSLEEQEEALALLKPVLSKTGKYLVDYVLRDVYTDKFQAGEDITKVLVTGLGEVEAVAARDKNGAIKLDGKGERVLVDEDSVNIATPMAVVEHGISGVEGEFDVSQRHLMAGLDKKFETLIENPNTSSAVRNMVVSLKHFNEVSAYVLPVHMQDSAMLLMTIDQMYLELMNDNGISEADMKKRMAEMDNWAEGIENVLRDNPTATVHDAIMTVSTMSGRAERLYEQNMMNVLFHYDVNVQLANEYEYKLNANNDGDPIAIPAEVAAVIKQARADYAARQKWMTGTLLKEDGSWKVIPYVFKTNLSDNAMSAVDAKYYDRMGTEAPKIVKTPATVPEVVKDNSSGNGSFDELGAISAELVEEGSSVKVVLMDYETNLDGDKKLIAELAVPNEVFMQVVTITNKGGEKVVEYGDKKHVVLPMSAEDAVVNDEVVAAMDGSYNTSDKISLLADTEGVDVAKDVAEINGAVKEFAGDLRVVTFNGKGFDDVISGIESIDLAEAGKEFKVKSSKNDKKGKQVDYHRELVIGSSIDVSKAHDAAVDVQILGEIFTAMVNKISSGESVEGSVEVGLGGTVSSSAIITGQGVEYDYNDGVLSEAEIAELAKSNKAYIDGNPRLRIDHGKGQFVWSKDVYSNLRTIGVDNSVGVGTAAYEIFLAHEIMHDKTHDWVITNENSEEIRIMREAVDVVTLKLDAIPDNKKTAEQKLVAARLGHKADMENENVGQLVETVAILAAEPQVRKEFLRLVDSSNRSLVNRILNAIKKILGAESTKVVEALRSIEAKGIESGVKVKSMNELANPAQSKSVIEPVEVDNIGLASDGARVRTDREVLRIDADVLDNNRMYEGKSEVDTDMDSMIITEVLGKVSFNGINSIVQKMGSDIQIVAMVENEYVDSFIAAGFGVIGDSYGRKIMLKKPVVAKAYHRRSNKPKQSETKINVGKFTAPVKDEGLTDVYTTFVSNSNGYIEGFINSGYYTAKPVSGGVLKEVHHKLVTKSKMYADSVDVLSGLWEGNEQIQQWRRYIASDDSSQKKVHELQAIKLQSDKEMMHVMEDMAAEMEGRMRQAGYSDEAVLSKIDDVLAKSGAFALVKNGMLKRLTDGEVSISELVSELESGMKKDGSSRGKWRKAGRMAAMYMGEAVEGKTWANVDALGFTRGTTSYTNMEALIALKAIEKVEGGLDVIKGMANGTELQKGVYQELLTAMLAMDAVNSDVHSGVMTQVKNGGKDKNVSRGNLVDDFSSKSYEFMVVTESSAKRLMGDKRAGWSVVRQPVGGKLGILAKEGTTEFQDGLVNASYIKTGIVVPSRLHDIVTDSQTPVMLTPTTVVGEDRVALVLTKDERSRLNYYNNPVKSLYRAYAHKKMVLESQVIRDTMLSGFTKELGKNAKGINAAVEVWKKQDELPLFIKVESRAPGIMDIKPGVKAKTKYSDDEYVYSKTIRNRYRPATKGILSDIGGFKDNVSWIRADMAQQVEGFTSGGTFKNSHQLNIAHKHLKNVVRWLKQNTIILNAPKIGMDFVAGMGVASANGASILESWEYGKEAIEGSARITKLVNRKLDLEFKVATGDKAVTTELASVKKQLENDPFSAALKRGFVQSLGTDILTRDRDTVQGLQVNMEEIIKKFTHTGDEGKLSEFNKLVNRAANFGGSAFSMETVYGKLSDGLRLTKVGEAPADVLERMSNDLKRIKSDKDMTAYMGELFASPNSTMVRFGAAMTVYADLLPRWIMYRHFINQNMSEPEAAEAALRALPNYLVGMPSSMKAVSDIYALAYPSFWTRAQRILFELATKKTASFGTQYGIAELLDSSGTSIVGANILNKVSNGSVFSMPTDMSVIPYVNIAG